MHIFSLLAPPLHDSDDEADLGALPEAALQTSHPDLDCMHFPQLWLKSEERPAGPFPEWGFFLLIAPPPFSFSYKIFPSPYLASGHSPSTWGRL